MIRLARYLIPVLLFSALIAGAASRKVIQPKEFAKGGPFSPGILVDGTLYVAGQVGRDFKSGKAPEAFDAEVRQTLDNIGLILKEAGMSFDDVVAVNVYLTDVSKFQDMNKVYMTYFREPRPARTTVEVSKLAGDFRIEITVTAKK